MQIVVNSDNHLRLSAESASRVESVIADALSRFGSRITRVEVHLTDENSGAKGGHDLRCVVEARLAGLQPIAATDQAVNLDQAVDGAVAKLEKTLDRTLDRRDNPKGRTSFAGEQ